LHPNSPIVISTVIDAVTLTENKKNANLKGEIVPFAKIGNRDLESEQKTTHNLEH